MTDARAVRDAGWVKPEHHHEWTPLPDSGWGGFVIGGSSKGGYRESCTCGKRRTQAWGI